MKKETLTFGTGKYVGEVKDGKPHGQGTLSGEKTLKGQWKNGEFVK